MQGEERGKSPGLCAVPGQPLLPSWEQTAGLGDRCSGPEGLLFGFHWGTQSLCQPGLKVIWTDCSASSDYWKEARIWFGGEAGFVEYASMNVNSHKPWLNLFGLPVVTFHTVTFPRLVTALHLWMAISHVSAVASSMQLCFQAQGLKLLIFWLY